MWHLQLHNFTYCLPLGAMLLRAEALLLEARGAVVSRPLLSAVGAVLQNRCSEQMLGRY